MDLSFWLCITLILNLAFSVPFSKGATFTFVNKCQSTVWPGILANAGTPSLGSTGFELPSDTSRSFQAPTGWSGRFWGRTSCDFSSSSSGSCATGDCGSGSAECNGAGAQPPVTLAEFTLGTVGQDFYDVSLVDGYNLPMLVEPSTGSDACASTGCLSDLNRACPEELKAGNGEACKSACEAFGSPEYCCSGAYGSPATCKPSIYSQMFKSACPRSYSYAYDDATSTFTCSGADYTITFCPSTPSQKSTTPTTPTTPATPATPVMTTPTTTTPDTSVGSGTEPEFGSGSMSFQGSASTGYQPGSSNSGTGSVVEGSGTQSNAMLTDGSWLAGLAMGDATKTSYPLTLLSVIANLSIFVCLVYLS